MIVKSYLDNLNVSMLIFQSVAPDLGGLTKKDLHLGQ